MLHAKYKWDPEKYKDLLYAAMDLRDSGRWPADYFSMWRICYLVDRGRTVPDILKTKVLHLSESHTRQLMLGLYVKQGPELDGFAKQ